MSSSQLMPQSREESIKRTEKVDSTVFDNHISVCHKANHLTILTSLKDVRSSSFTKESQKKNQILKHALTGTTKFLIVPG